MASTQICPSSIDSPVVLGQPGAMFSELDHADAGKVRAKLHALDLAPGPTRAA